MSMLEPLSPMPAFDRGGSSASGGLNLFDFDCPLDDPPAFLHLDSSDSRGFSTPRNTDADFADMDGGSSSPFARTQSGSFGLQDLPLLDDCLDSADVPVSGPFPSPTVSTPGSRLKSPRASWLEDLGDTPMCKEESTAEVILPYDKSAADFVSSSVTSSRASVVNASIAQSQMNSFAPASTSSAFSPQFYSSIPPVSSAGPAYVSAVHPMSAAQPAKLELQAATLTLPSQVPSMPYLSGDASAVGGIAHLTAQPTSTKGPGRVGDDGGLHGCGDEDKEGKSDSGTEESNHSASHTSSTTGSGAGTKSGRRKALTIAERRKKYEQRLMRNREAANRSRARKKAEAEKLQTENEKLKVDYEAKCREVTELQAELKAKAEALEDTKRLLRELTSRPGHVVRRAGQPPEDAVMRKRQCVSDRDSTSSDSAYTDIEDVDAERASSQRRRKKGSRRDVGTVLLAVTFTLFFSWLLPVFGEVLGFVAGIGESIATAMGIPVWSMGFSPRSLETAAPDAPHSWFTRRGRGVIGRVVSAGDGEAEDESAGGYTHFYVELIILTIVVGLAFLLRKKWRKH